MSAGARLAFDASGLHLSGELDFGSVVPIEREGRIWIRDRAPRCCRVDLGAVSRSDSSGTALLLSWLRTAAAAGKALHIERVPEDLRALFGLAGLDDVLGAGPPPVPAAAAGPLRDADAR